jgi:outer membrane protein assembly factor BamC
VRIERSGQQRWLVVNRPPEVLWNNVREFWKDSGFELAVEQEALGVLETEWTENRSKLPQDFIRSTIGRLFDGLYSTGERDKFRTRLERNAEGKTEIYITHRGLEEVYTSEAKDKTTWQPRANDLGLESEFLRRLMLKLGAPSAQAQALSSVPPISKAAQVTIANGTANLALNDSFDTTWRRVGLALDRTGFTVEDRNRAEGRYFVRYVPNSAGNTEKPKEGLFARLFSSKKTEEIAPARYQITVKAQGTQTLLSVLNTKGEPEATGVAQRILEVIAADLK